MFFLNLTLGEFLALFGAASGLLTALYLLDRSRRKQVVATLRFWTEAEKPTEWRRRRRIRQPLSLLLQIVSIALLLLALAQLRLGSRDESSRDHVLILDTSAWMAARSGQGTLMDQARASALAYVRALPAGDRVMLVHADALATPVTSFESNRQVLENAIRQAFPTSAALHLDQALEFARRVQSRHARRGGEIVFAGAARVAESDSDTPVRTLSNLRFLPVKAAVENVGLRKIGLRRQVSEVDLWEIFVSVRNYGVRARVVELALQFGGAPLGSRRLRLPPGDEQEATFTHRTRAAGLLEARLLTRDGFPEDDRTVLDLPPLRSLRVAVYSNRPELLRPLLAANPLLDAVFLRPSEYDPGRQARVVILDRFRPPVPPGTDSIWIEPPVDQGPFAVRTIAENVPLERWRSDSPLAAGLRTTDLRLDSTQVYAAAPDDAPVAEVQAGPVILARTGKPPQPWKTVVFGFHPMRSAMRYQVSSPLLFANILRWMAPDVFRRWELTAGSVGAVSVELEAGADPDNVRVLAQDGAALPFTVHEGTLRFFAGMPGSVRVLAADREMVYSLTLPEVAESVWEPPPDTRTGVPAARRQVVSSRDLWRWLALLGGLGLLVEWLWFGRARRPFAGGLLPIDRLRGRIPWLRTRPLRPIGKAS